MEVIRGDAAHWPRSISRGPSMARATAANAFLRSKSERSVLRARNLSIPDHDPRWDVWMRRAVPAMIGLFLATIVGAAIVNGVQNRQQAIDDAVGEMELI